MSTTLILLISTLAVAGVLHGVIAQFRIDALEERVKRLEQR